MNDTQPPPPRGTSPFSGRTNLTEAEQQMLADRFKNAAVATPIWPLAEHEFTPQQPTAWQSLPKPIRFAVWLWAIAVIIGFIAAVFSLVFWLITAGFVISQM